MERALFLIDTPSHVINVREALKSYSLTEYDLMINDCNRADTFIQLKAMIGTLTPPSKIVEVAKVEGGLNERIHAYAQHLPFLLSRQYSHVFISSTRQHWQRDIVCSLNISKIVLLDDGNATIPFYEYFFSKGIFFDFPDDPDIQRRSKAAEIRNYYNISIVEPTKIELFTYFDLKPLPWLSIKRNSLTSLQKDHKKIDDSLVYIIGVGAVTVKYTSQADYLDLLNRTRALMPDKTFCYIPHRIESQELIDDIEKIGFLVNRLNMPIENWIYQLDVAPCTVLSYYSTALFTCATMFKSIRTISIQPDMSTWLGAKSSHVWNLKSCNNYQLVETIYKYLNADKSIESILI
ncbi:polysialyltransferase family glycosyltransferase [Rheinheimera faecalis]